MTKSNDMDEYSYLHDSSGTGRIKYSIPDVISIEDLMKNKIATTLIIDELKAKTAEAERLANENDELKSSQMSLSVKISVALSNIIGTILASIGVNMVTSEKSSSISWIILSCGAILSLITSLLPIINPWQIKYSMIKKKVAILH